MHVAVVRIADLGRFPPAISLVRALLDLGHEVTLLANGTGNLPRSVRCNERFRSIELGKRTTAKDRLVQMVAAPRTIREYLRRNRSRIDVLWTTTDISARAVGRLALSFVHVMQISELVEFTPAILMHNVPLHSRMVPELARNAAAVVVPEYNRAHIQKVWWHLPVVPKVLPNKPYPDIPLNDSNAPWAVQLDKIKSDVRRVVLYQGVYAADRSLIPYAEAMAVLGEDYVMYTMGSAQDSIGAKMIEELKSKFPNVVDLGFVPAPNHLVFTQYGHIGLLPYVAGGNHQFSPLNALYCAPNKIWEYARFGLPMLGSDVPGLSSIFTARGIGMTSASDPKSIAKGISALWDNYEEVSSRSREYYETVDFRRIVADIIESVTRR